MNSTQTQQWNDFACMSETLIAAAAMKKIALTADAYRTKYEGKFPLPQSHYGGLILSRFFWIACDIGLGSEMDLLWFYSRVKEEYHKGRTVFVFSGLHLDPSRSDDFAHVSALRSIGDQKFAVTGMLIDLPVGDWVKKRCCGIVMY